MYHTAREFSGIFYPYPHCLWDTSVPQLLTLSDLQAERGDTKPYTSRNGNIFWNYQSKRPVASFSGGPQTAPLQPTTILYTFYKIHIRLFRLFIKKILWGISIKLQILFYFLKLYASDLWSFVYRIWPRAVGIRVNPFLTCTLYSNPITHRLPNTK